MPKTPITYSTVDAVIYLEDKHGISLTDSGLRMHIKGGKRYCPPTLHGMLHPTMHVYFFTPGELDKFAEAYKKLQKEGNHLLGNVGRKRSRI